MSHFKKSTARSGISKPDMPSVLIPLEFEEQCSLCDRYIEDGRVVLRHELTRNIICALCLVGIAEVL